MLGDLLSYLDFTMKDIEKSNTHIEEKYPKFLSKFALFALQMDDTLFRETFIVQILIFTQAITDPVGNEHKNTVKLSPEDIKSVQKVQKQAKRIIVSGQKKTSSTTVSRQNDAGIGKRTFGESVEQIVSNCEPQWANWKKNACQSFEIRPNNNNNATRIKQKMQDRRNAKALQKQLINKKPILKP